MITLKTDSISKTYQTGDVKIKAVNDVNISLEKGKIYVILGKSGCGKSTLLNIIGGIDPPDAGEVYIDGQGIYNLREKTRTSIRSQKIGYIFQAFNLVPEFTLLENIRLPFDIQGREYDLEYEKQLLEILELKAHINFYPKQLSGGQQQRVAILRALLLKPSIILADEPTGNLDKESSERLINFVRETNKSLGQTYVIVTHDNDWINIAHETLFMSDGRFENTHENKKA